MPEREERGREGEMVPLTLEEEMRVGVAGFVQAFKAGDVPGHLPSPLPCT